MGSPSAGVDAGAATRWWAVTVVAAVGLCLSVVDSGVMSAALPAVRGAVAVSADDAVWIGTASLLCQAMIMPAGAWLAERWGLRRTHLIALALFAALSLLASQAWNSDSLFLFRTVQAVPGALVPVVSTALLCRLVPPGRRRVALSAYGLCVVAAVGVTPLVGAHLVGHGPTWRAVLAVDALVAVVVAVAARFVAPAVPGRRGRRFDVLGYLCVLTGLSTLLVAVSQGPRWGWTSYAVLMPATAGVLTLALFVVIELEVDEPLVDLRAAGTRAVVGVPVLLAGLYALWAHTHPTSTPAYGDVVLLAGVCTVIGVAAALTTSAGRRAPAPAAPAAPAAQPAAPAPAPEPLPVLAWRPAQVVAPGGRAGRGGTSLTHLSCRPVGSRRDHGLDPG